MYLYNLSKYRVKFSDLNFCVKILYNFVNVLIDFFSMHKSGFVSFCKYYATCTFAVECSLNKIQVFQLHALIK